jgi:uncharacterized membrane protein
MYWGFGQRAGRAFKSSLWTVPLIAIPFALVATRILHWLDGRIEWSFLGFSVSGAQTLLQAVSTATLSFMVFTFSSLLIAIQVASGTLTPRIIATTLLQNSVIRYTVGLFMFTWLLAIGVQNRIDQRVYELPLLVAGILGVLSFAAFFYLIDRASRLLRPITVLSNVGTSGLAVIRSVYPQASQGPARAGAGRRLDAPVRSVAHKGTSGSVLAINVDKLMREAETANGVIEFVPQVGDFVAVDEPLFNLFGGAAAVEDRVLRAAVAFGSERTMEQDPTFAFRIVIDIALKALSPAINDPTTAVLAIDQLHRLLRMVGTRHLRIDDISDEAGNLRLILRTPNWEDFVDLAFSEIRFYGGTNLQIVRRLRAMIENLMQTLPEHRHRELLHQLELLDRAVKKTFENPEELALAHVGDTQGLGGHAAQHMNATFDTAPHDR